MISQTARTMRTAHPHQPIGVVVLVSVLFGNEKRGCCLADTVNNAKSTKITLLWFRTSLNNNQIKPKLRQNIKQHDVLATFFVSAFYFPRSICRKKRISCKETWRAPQYHNGKSNVFYSIKYSFFSASSSSLRGIETNKIQQNFKFIALRFQA